MPSDTGAPYNLHFPELTDPPNVPSDIEMLAGDVHDELTRVDANAARGWIPIGSARVDNAADFTVDLTKGGEFPGGTFDLIEFHMRFDLDAVGWIVGRPNNASTIGLYNSSSLTWGADGLNKDAFFNGATQGWRVAHGSVNSGSNLDMKLFHTNGDNLLNFQGTSTRADNNSNTVSRWNQHWGNLNSLLGTTVTSFNFSASIGAAEFITAWWWATGYRS